MIVITGSSFTARDMGLFKSCPGWKTSLRAYAAVLLDLSMCRKILWSMCLYVQLYFQKNVSLIIINGQNLVKTVQQ